MLEVQFLSMPELEAGLDYVRQSPRDNGTLKMIVRRPKEDAREVVESAEIDLYQGLIGDNWKTRGSKRTSDGSANPNAQITVTNVRAIHLMAREMDRYPLAGDQLYVDMDLSDDNLPPGTRLRIGSVVLEVSADPHTGCNKFSARFGMEALKFVNSPEGKRLHLRGINTRVVEGGILHVGDAVKKL